MTVKRHRIFFCIKNMEPILGIICSFTSFVVFIKACFLCVFLYDRSMKRWLDMQRRLEKVRVVSLN